MAEWNLLPFEEARLRRIATDEALLAKDDHGYLPKTPEEAERFSPHEWVLEAMRHAYSLGRVAGGHMAREEIRKALGVKS
jgi:hypothetical protein